MLKLFDCTLQHEVKMYTDEEHHEPDKGIAYPVPYSYILDKVREKK